MATTRGRGRSRTRSTDFVGRLADAGEDALQRLSDLPGGQRFVSGLNDLRNRVDDLSRKVRGIDDLERRVAKLEKDLAALKKTRSSSAARTSASRTSSSS